VNRISRDRQNKYGKYVKERVLEVACFFFIAITVSYFLRNYWNVDV